MQIAGLQKTTLVDFPGHIAATVFTRGCSFCCPFCHNPELVLPSQFIELISEDQIWEFFEKRQGQLEGICITGGEPTIQPDLAEFIKKLTALGYKIKLDTNGWNAEILNKLIEAGNIDYIAMDIKASPEKYIEAATGSKKTNLKVLTQIKKSIQLIMNSGVDYEFRTTVCHPIHEVVDFEAIGEMIKGAKRYFIQNFVKSKQIAENIDFKPFSDEELDQSKKIMKKYVETVEVR